MIVGVTGYAQHGKDTVANLLERDYGFRKMAFADALRKSVLVLDPFVPLPGWTSPVRYSELLDSVGYEEAKKNPEVRRLLQVMGTEVGRDILGDDTWVHALNKARNGPARVVIPDVRFPNEGDYVLNANHGHHRLVGVVRVNPDGTPFDNGIGTEHASEAHVASLLLRADVTFVASDVETLEEQANDWMKELL